MTLFVPFDSSELARAALIRAVQFDKILEEGVVVVTAIPNNNTQYAREREWLAQDQSFDPKQVVSQIRDEVREIAPGATFEYVVVSRYAQPGEIASKIRSKARAHDASIVFIGSENAGRVVRSISVGQTVSTDSAYDTMLISHAAPSKSQKLEEQVPTDDIID